MPPKKKQNIKFSQPASANANCNTNSASGDQAGHDSDYSHMDCMPLIWEKIADKILENMNDRFDKLEQTLQLVQTSQRELVEKVESVEQQMLDHEGHITCLEKMVLDLKDENNTLKLKVDDLEGRSRRNNIKIIGIPEREEGGKPTEFVKALIPKLFEEGSFQSPVVIDRAHRTLQPPPTAAAGANPRAIIARVHFYREKELILRLRRERKLDYKGNKVLIFPDYTPEVELKVEHSLLFPARLRMKHGEWFKAYNTRNEAITFINTDLKNTS